MGSASDLPEAPRSFVLHEASHPQLAAYKPKVAVLPWGATEAHNRHLPCGADVIEATTLAARSAAIAHAAGARPVVLPAIPFGNNAQQQDQVATVTLSTSTAAAILMDVVRSLKRQGIDRLIVLNSHGGNDFKPLIRDAQLETGSLIVLINFFQMLPELEKRVFDQPGDHAGELETSFLLHVCPSWVKLEEAGPGSRVPFALKTLSQPGVWTPRPWSQSHPDTGAGDPSRAAAERGAEYVAAISEAIAKVIIELSGAQRGQLPYI